MDMTPCRLVEKYHSIEYYLLGCNAVYFCTSSPTSRRNLVLPSSVSKNNPKQKISEKQAASRDLSEEHSVSIFRVMVKAAGSSERFVVVI